MCDTDDSSGCIVSLAAVIAAILLAILFSAVVLINKFYVSLIEDPVERGLIWVAIAILYGSLSNMKK